MFLDFFLNKKQPKKQKNQKQKQNMSQTIERIKSGTSKQHSL